MAQPSNMKNLVLFIGIFLLCAAQTTAQTQIKFYTTMGDFIVEMSDSLTPITSGNFIDLTDQEYYDGVIFHRVIDNFMIQGGDPTGTGTGGPGYTIPDEFDSTGTLSNVQKTISMANSGPNTGGSQFFINLVNNTYLDFDNAPFSSAHPVFGMVIDSFEVVQAIGGVSVNGNNRPLTDVVMDSLRVIYRPSNDTIVDTTPPAGYQKSAALSTKVFPNPIGQESVVIIESKEAGNAQISVIDAGGRVVISTNRNLRIGMNRFTGFGLESLSRGFYTMHISQGDHRHSHSLLVTR